jgi:hypothetical protein
MQTFDERLHDVSAQLGCEPEQVLAVLDRLSGELRRRRYYYYVNTKTGAKEEEQGARPAQPRTIPVFPWPDDALAYAQYNGSPEVPKVRGADKRWLLLTLLKNDRLSAILFMDKAIGPGPLPAQAGATRITRQQLLEALTVSAEI